MSNILTKDMLKKVIKILAVNDTLAKPETRYWLPESFLTKRQLKIIEKGKAVDRKILKALEDESACE
jgi:hypothetical protein